MKGMTMRRYLLIATALLAWAGFASAHGILIPDDKNVPPLAMLNHKVTIAIEDQVAVTKIEQMFRNHTEGHLPSTYVFPVPKGAAVNQFSMWVDGKEVKGELIEAAKAQEIYASIIRRSQNPALLEYLDNNLLRLRVDVKADLKIGISYTAITQRDGDVIEYAYPLKTDGRTNATLKEFSLNATIKGQHAIQNVYSPTHSLTVKRVNDREVAVSFDKNQALLDKDFRLFYSQGASDIGLTTITHRPIKDENGYFLMLITPKVEMAKENQIARDMVLVLDTSGSMRGVKIEQAKKALKFCLSNLGPKDRFAMIDFSAKVIKYRDGLTEGSNDELTQAKTWVDKIQATGGTNINDALLTALAMRSNDPGRTFNVVFFTDGLPTVSERDPQKIIKNVMEKSSGNTRIFSFGVGNDVNATFLDRLSAETRALSTYVRPQEDIEEKVSVLYSKISHPVLANLKLSVGPNVTLEEVYPPHLPDLFEGGQLTVLGRYTGHGAAEVKLTGTVGKEPKEFVYKTNFAEKSAESKEFVEHLWARRKVGYLLDQIRANGQKKELVDEVTALGKRYGIATPYTSYLIVPDAPLPVAGKGPGGFIQYGVITAPEALAPKAPGMAPTKVAEFAKQAQTKAGELAGNRGKFEDDRLNKAPGNADGKPLQEAKEKKDAFDQARAALAKGAQGSVQSGKLGVDLSVQGNNLRNQCRLEQTALRRVANRTCMEIGGVWIDEAFDAKTPTVAVKAQSDAYFRILAKQPQVRAVFQLGNHLVWLTPSGTALVIDTNDGQEKLTDEEIDKLFAAKK
jgi:Ca-activated chloride channel family protein